MAQIYDITFITAMESVSEFILEACVESLEEVQHALRTGASRIELCRDLEHEGLTPDRETILAVMDISPHPVKVMLRPRAGSFEYDDNDRALIMEELSMLNEVGIYDIVFGATSNGGLDYDLIKLVLDSGTINSLTIHKAIDQTDDILRSIDRIREEILPIAPKLSILSSGGSETALEGSLMLNKMQALCGEEIELIVAGKVTKANLKEVVSKIPSRAYHGRRIV